MNAPTAHGPYLLRKTGKNCDLVSLVSDPQLAVALAREWVGEKTSDLDGCATERRENVVGVVGNYSGDPGSYWIFRARRSTSFGERRATVRPLLIDDAAEKGLD